MKLEVEQKYRIEDVAAFRNKLAELGIELGEPKLQVDQYFAHPLRDFAATDEALRIRRSGEATYVTYKGPKVDQTTKTREEIELPIPAGDENATAMFDLFVALSFRPVVEVRKTRRTVHVNHDGYHVELSLDEVKQLGTFVELEIMADRAGLDAARACLGSLATELRLAGSERRGYADLLLLGGTREHDA